MKKLLTAIGFLALISSCKESNELINLTDDNKVTIDSNYNAKVLPAPQDKNVYVEDLTGVRCTNCPSAHQIIAAIEGAHKNRVVAVSIAPPSKEADQIASLLGSYTGLPTGDVDRKIFSGESKILIEYQKWQGYSSSEIALSSPVNVSFTNKSYDPAKKIFDGDVKVIFTDNVSEATYLTIMLTESNIIDPQETAIDTNLVYVHNHILRKTFTQYNGFLLGQNIKSAQTFVIHYRGPVDNMKYVINNLNIVAIVHHRGTNNEVIQAVKTTLQ